MVSTQSRIFGSVLAIIALAPGVMSGQTLMTARGNDVFFLANASQDAAPQGPTDERIKIRDINTGRDREIFRPKFGRIFDFRVSPSSTMTAVTEQLRKFADPPKRTQADVNDHILPLIFERMALHIVDRAGKQIDTIEGNVLYTLPVTTKAMTRLIKTRKLGSGTRLIRVAVRSATASSTM
jgi:hypothetical protein